MPRCSLNACATAAERAAARVDDERDSTVDELYLEGCIQALAGCAETRCFPRVQRRGSRRHTTRRPRSSAYRPPLGFKPVGLLGNEPPRLPPHMPTQTECPAAASARSQARIVVARMSSRRARSTAETTSGTDTLAHIAQWPSRRGAALDWRRVSAAVGSHRNVPTGGGRVRDDGVDDHVDDLGRGIRDNTVPVGRVSVGPSKFRTQARGGRGRLITIGQWAPASSRRRARVERP